MFAWVCRVGGVHFSTQSSPIQPLPYLLVFVSALVKADVDFEFLCRRRSGTPQFSWQHFLLLVVNCLHTASNANSYCASDLKDS